MRRVFLAVMLVGVVAGAITNVDYTAAHAVRELQRDLAGRGTGLVLAHVQSDLKPDLDRHRLTCSRLAKRPPPKRRQPRPARRWRFRRRRTPRPAPRYS